MTEEEFDALMPWQPFRREDWMQSQAEVGRCATVGIALWGKTADDLQRQLNAIHPEIPAGCDLADLRSLQRYVQKVADAVNDPRNGWLSSLALPSWNLLIGTQTVTAWEARGEIVRRAIDYLEKR